MIQIKLQIKPALFSIKTTLMYGALAAGFSLIGIYSSTALPGGDVLLSATVEHVVGHVIWGMVAAFAALSFRHIFAGGFLALALDGDHLLGFLNIDYVTRMSHSIPFALLAPICMMIIFGRRDFLLGAISFAAVFSHMSLDTFLGGGAFPLLTPFSNHFIVFDGTDWIILQLIAIIAVLGAKLIIYKKNRIKKKLSKE